MNGFCVCVCVCGRERDRKKKKNALLETSRSGFNRNHLACLAVVPGKRRQNGSGSFLFVVVVGSRKPNRGNGKTDVFFSRQSDDDDDDDRDRVLRPRRWFFVRFFLGGGSCHRVFSSADRRFRSLADSQRAEGDHRPVFFDHREREKAVFFLRLRSCNGHSKNSVRPNRNNAKKGRVFFRLSSLDANGHSPNTVRANQEARGFELGKNNPREGKRVFAKQIKY
mmetsp:Transcript_19575/g.45618  ORF Transcript_19575/g.45618 Transcript_19575/m.45618 type:complete len:223 (-) Transcript_19575:46-714(-)